MTTRIRAATDADAEPCGRIIFEAFKGIAEQHAFPLDAKPTGEFLPLVLGRRAKGHQTNDPDVHGQIPGAEPISHPFCTDWDRWVSAVVHDRAGRESLTYEDRSIRHGAISASQHEYKVRSHPSAPLNE